MNADASTITDDTSEKKFWAGNWKKIKEKKYTFVYFIFWNNL